MPDIHRDAAGVPAVEAESLRKVFPGRKGSPEVEAVAGIDLAVREGEIFGFLGPNGAGKTTTIRILTCLLRPSSGRARVLGWDVAHHSQEIRFSIGTALQEAGLDHMSTGRELLVLQGRLYGLRGQEPGRRASELLELVGLSEAADRRVKAYSGGMKRRLDLACALVHGPRLLFLDEPTAGLDPASRRAIWDEVRRLNRHAGMTVFLTTQYMEEADQLADRLAIIDHGHIVAEGKPEGLKASIAADVVTVDVPSDHLGKAREALGTLEGLGEIGVEGSELTLFVSDGSGTVARVVRLLDAAGIHAESVTLSSPTLDEVFLRATGSRLEGAHIPERPAEGDGGGTR